MHPRFDQTRHLRRNWVLLWFLGCAMAFPTAAFCQPRAANAFLSRQYKYKKDSKEFKEKKSQIDAMLKEGTGFSVDAIKDFYEGFYLAHGSQPEQLENVNDFRNGINQDMQNLYRGAMGSEAKKANVEAYNKLLKAMLVHVAESNYHPAFRVNAVHLLGYFELSRDKNAIYAYMPALGDLVRIVGKSDSPDAVRIAALPGIRRYVPYLKTAKPEIVGAIAKPLVQWMTDPQPVNRRDEVHRWIQVECVDILSQMINVNHYTGPEEAVLRKFVVDQLYDKHSRSKIRYISAIAVGRLSWTNPEESMKVATGLCHLTYHMVDDWSTLVQNTISPPSAMGGGYGGGMGSGMGDTMGGDMGYSGMPSGGEGYGSDTMGGYGDMMGGQPGQQNRPKETLAQLQPPEVRVKRRQLHQILDALRKGFLGTSAKDTTAAAPNSIVASLESNENHAELVKICDRIKSVQEKANGPTIKDLPGLKKEIDEPFKELIEFSALFPGVEDIDIPPTPDPAAGAAPKT